MRKGFFLGAIRHTIEINTPKPEGRPVSRIVPISVPFGTDYAFASIAGFDFRMYKDGADNNVPLSHIGVSCDVKEYNPSEVLVEVSAKLITDKPSDGFNSEIIINLVCFGEVK